MIHTKWNGIDKYNYSSHITYTGNYSGDEVEKDLKDCISQTLATVAESTQDWNWAMSHPCFCLQIPTALDGSKTNTVSPFSMSSFGPPSLCPDGTTFWQEYEKRRGSKNGIENGLMLLMDVETFENAHYPR